MPSSSVGFVENDTSINRKQTQELRVSSKNTWPMILCTLTEHQTDSEVTQRVLINCIRIFRAPRPVIPFAYNST